MRTQTNFENLEDEDPQISYMISSWARMCKILGKDFEKYLPVVMGPVLKTASFKPEIAVVDGKLKIKLSGSFIKLFNPFRPMRNIPGGFKF